MSQKLVVEITRAKVVGDTMLFALPDEEMLHLPAKFCKVVDDEQ